MRLIFVFFLSGEPPEIRRRKERREKKEGNRKEGGGGGGNARNLGCSLREAAKRSLVGGGGESLSGHFRQISASGGKCSRVHVGRSFRGSEEGPAARTTRSRRGWA